MHKTFLSITALAFGMLVAAPIIHAEEPKGDPPTNIAESFDQGIYFFCDKYTKTSEPDKRNADLLKCMQEQQREYNGLLLYKQEVKVPSFILTTCIYSHLKVDVQWADFVKVNHCVRHSVHTTDETKVSF